MALPMGHEDLQKLKSFIDFVSSNPTVLNYPQLEFVKTFIEKFGGKVPTGEFKMPGGGCPFGGGNGGGVKTEPKQAEAEAEPQPEEAEMDSESESEVELNMEGVIEGDVGASQPMGDSSKTPTEEEIEQASDLRSTAAAAYSEQNFQEAIDLYTKAIELNPGNALFHAKRGQAFLKLKQPNACIRDCDKALELNCDSAAAYKFRGRAHRLLGNWELAAKDLRQACKLDFDEEADEWLREVTPNAKKIDQHRIKQERKKAEKELRKREERIRKAQDANKKAREQQQEHSTGTGTGGFPGFPGAGGAGGAGGASGLNIEDLLSGFSDPEIAAALQDIAKNPANIEKYKSNPKISKLIDIVKGMGGGGFPGGFPGFPGGFPAGGAAPDVGGAANTTPPPEATEESKPTNPKKPDFVDDGLD